MVREEKFGIKNMGERKLDAEGCQGIRFKNVTPEVFSCMKKNSRTMGSEFHLEIPECLKEME